MLSYVQKCKSAYGLCKGAKVRGTLQVAAGSSGWQDLYFPANHPVSGFPLSADLCLEVGTRRRRVRLFPCGRDAVAPLPDSLRPRGRDVITIASAGRRMVAEGRGTIYRALLASLPPKGAA